MEGVLPVSETDVEEVVARMRRGEPPSSVQEYMWRVRLEAEGIPKVVVAELDRGRYHNDQPKEAHIPAAFAKVADTGRVPTEVWKKDVVADFGALREFVGRWHEAKALQPQELVKVPRMKDAEAWHTFFFGDGDTDGHAPHLRLLLQFDQVLTRWLLGYQVEWLEETPLTQDRAAWIYALLARLDKPLHADTAALLRQLLRQCWEQRSAAGDIADSTLRALNVVIVIAGDYFGQLREDDGQ